MSAILSADDLNDFITPGVACIKPVETLPKQEDPENPYEVTTEDKVAQQNIPPAQISLTDCLACSGCVTSAEAVLVSLQSHAEVLRALDSAPEFQFSDTGMIVSEGSDNNRRVAKPKIFVASVSPQVRASLAVTYGISQQEAGHLIEQFLSGAKGLRAGGQHGSGFTWVVDTNVVRDLCLKLTVEEVVASIQKSEGNIALSSCAADGEEIPQRPVLASACPGWICYAEKTHPYVLPHMSRLKSPQALMGTLLKTVLSRVLNVLPSQIWHLALMPCFDKKLEASRAELTDVAWSGKPHGEPVRDVDCVITSRELLQLADARGIDLNNLSRLPLPSTHRAPFPDARFSSFLFPETPYSAHNVQPLDAGTSGGYLHHLLRSHQRSKPGTQIKIQRGRNSDVVEYTLVDPGGNAIIKAARYYGFRNIQNLVRKLKPSRPSRLLGAVSKNKSSPSSISSPFASSIASTPTTITSRRPVKSASTNNSTSLSDYAYIEVMACPGGCTNGGGQIRPEDAKVAVSRPSIASLTDVSESQKPEQQVCVTPKPSAQRAWLAQVDVAYYNGVSVNEADGAGNHEGDHVATDLEELMSYWSELTAIPLSKLTKTTYHEVESYVGKGDTARVAEFAGRLGGGW
ncbi:Cytosolic Fe-S cluster assembly factor nar1 [Ascosphaera aggregata]|nr:Cytosolic Fe-S cluster assembly factor nar1 [Ascosphaera aggregata]